jgi:hypothetical protein
LTKLSRYCEFSPGNPATESRQPISLIGWVSERIIQKSPSSCCNADRDIPTVVATYKGKWIVLDNEI